MTFPKRKTIKASTQWDYSRRGPQQSGAELIAGRDTAAKRGHTLHLPSTVLKLPIVPPSQSTQSKKSVCSRKHHIEEQEQVNSYLLGSLGEERFGGLEQLPRGAVGQPLPSGHGREAVCEAAGVLLRLSG